MHTASRFALLFGAEGSAFSANGNVQRLLPSGPEILLEWECLSYVCCMAQQGLVHFF